MNYSKYYTPYKISELLIGQIEIDACPVSAIDICCGSCNLLFAAKKRWPDIQVTGVDVVDTQVADIAFIQSDGRKFAQDHKIKYKIVLANPPFENLDVKNQYPGLGKGIIDHYTAFRLENEMLLANLQLLDDHGVLMAIMPSTFIEGITNRALRKAIAKVFHIQKVIRLPDSAFGSSKIKCYALILAKRKNKKNYTRYYTIPDREGVYRISKASIIAQHYIKDGCWLEQTNDLTVTMSLDIKRGNISSHFFSEPRNSIRILHTSKYDDDWSASLQYIKTLPVSAIFAEDGDIIISRIGKSAGCWYEYHGNAIAISDCLFRIGKPPAYVKAAMAGQRYTGVIRGVSTPYITKSDIHNWLSGRVR